MLFVILKLIFTRSVFICLGFLILNFAFSGKISAADVSLVVSPPRIDFTGLPGEEFQQVVKITNNSETKELILQVFVIDFIVQDGEGTPVKVTESASGRYLASPWFTLNQTELVIAPKEQQEIIALINVPEDALPGGHYAGIFFEPVEKRGSTQTVSYTSTQVGALFGINVEGDITYDALIKSFFAKELVSEFGPIEFSAVLENQSDTHIRPISSITIYDLIGRRLTEIKLDELNIFPFASRTLSGTWDTVWGLGRYRADLSVTYGPGLVATRSLYFWIMPYRLIATALIIMGVVLVIFILIRRHLKHQQDGRDQEIEDLRRKIAQMENTPR